MAKEYPESQVKPNVDDFPAIQTKKPPFRGRRAFASPGYKKLASWTAKTVARQLLKPVSEEAKAHPQIQLNYGETNWWTLSKFDSALATNAEGTGLFWYRRDPEQLKSKLAQAAKLHVQLVTGWDKLREQYRSKAAEVASYDAWAKTFAEHTDSELTR